MVIWSTSHQGCFDILMIMGRECSRHNPSYQLHNTLHVQAANNYIPITVYALLPSTCH